MISPTLGPIIVNERHPVVSSLMERCYTDSLTQTQCAWQEADINFRIVSGDQSAWMNSLGAGGAGGAYPWGRTQITDINMTRPFIQGISGHQRNNRKAIVVVPVHNGNEITADQYTKVMYHIDRTAGASEIFSEGFQDALVGGMNMIEVWLDFRNDPISGDIRIENRPYSSYVVDPWFKKADLSDANFMWSRRYMSKMDCIALLPGMEEDILPLQGNSTGASMDGKFNYMSESFGYAPKNMLFYDTFYYRDMRDQMLLTDTMTGECMEWEHGEDKLRMFLASNPNVNAEMRKIPTYRMAISVQGRVMWDGYSPLGIDRLPFCPIFSYFNPNISEYPFRIQSVVTQLRNPQFLYNRFIKNISDGLEAQANAPLVYKPDSMINPLDIWTTSGAGKQYALKKEAQMSDIMRMPASEISQGMALMAQEYKQVMHNVTGWNEALQGMADGDVGILEMLKQSAGLTMLKPLFDQLDFALKHLGRLFLDIVTNNYTPGKIQLILGEQPSPHFYKQEFGKYDCAIEEGWNTTTQRQFAFLQLMELKKLGFNIPEKRFIEALTIQDKQQLIEEMEQAQQQAAQAQQMQMQQQMQLQQAQAELAKARAVSDRSLGYERISRVEENHALAQERRSASVRDEVQAVLNYIKAAKELEGIDINQLKDIFSIQQLLKAEENVDAAKIDAKGEMQKQDVLRQSNDVAQQPNQGYAQQQAQTQSQNVGM